MPSNRTFSPSSAFELVGSLSVAGVELSEAAAMAWERLTPEQQRWAVDHFTYQQHAAGAKAEQFCRWCLDQPWVLNSSAVDVENA